MQSNFDFLHALHGPLENYVSINVSSLIKNDYNVVVNMINLNESIFGGKSADDFLITDPMVFVKM